MTATPIANGVEFQVNTFTTQGQDDATVTALSDGGFVVTWTSDDQDGSFLGVYGQRYDTAGNQVGAEFQVNTSTASSQSTSATTALSGGGFVVTWQALQVGGNLIDIYAQQYDANGAAVGGEFRVNTTLDSHQIGASISGLADGGYVITWTTRDGGVDNPYSIAAQRFDANGQAVGAELSVNTVTASIQATSDVVGLASGGFVVTWASFGQDGSLFDVYAQRYDKAGNPVWGGEFQVNTTTAGSQGFSTVTALENGGFLITWSSTLQDGSGTGAYGQIYDVDGRRVGGEFQINTTEEGRQGFTQATALKDGGFL